MPGSLTHSPADILSRALIALGEGVDPGSTPWPIFVGDEPASPDNCITVYNTAGRDQGRVMITGEMQGPHGVQIRVRAQEEATGWTKANDILHALDQEIYQESVTISDTTYLVHAVSSTGKIFGLGKESPDSSRKLWTINAVVMVREAA